MEYYQIYPYKNRTIVDEIPAPFSNKISFLIRADVASASDFVGLQQELLLNIDSDWPPSWNGVIDQYCFSEAVEAMSSITIILAVSKKTPLLQILELTEALSAIDQHHKHLSVTLSVWIK